MARGPRADTVRLRRLTEVGAERQGVTGVCLHSSYVEPPAIGMQPDQSWEDAEVLGTWDDDPQKQAEQGE